VLSFLLDEQISPEIAQQIKNKRPDIPIFTIHLWQKGYYLGVSDEIILKAATEERLTLITYDQKTIPPILSEWGTANINHAGVIFIDYSSIPPNNFGKLVKAIIWLWDTQNKRDWQNRIVYLQPGT
jgi:predicted nuclease of predicted toxin-antitoxin system